MLFRRMVQVPKRQALSGEQGESFCPGWVQAVTPGECLRNERRVQGNGMEWKLV
jgi:hypothetical protein